MFHKVVLVGNLGRDPEMRYTPAGKAVTNLSVATNRQYTNSDGEVVKQVVWFRVAVWGKQAEACNQYLRKGRQVLVEGRLIGDDHGNPRVYERQDGSSGAAFELNAEVVRFLGSRPAEVAEEPTGDGEEIPF